MLLARVWTTARCDAGRSGCSSPAQNPACRPTGFLSASV